jgi:hypothetical protein
MEDELNINKIVESLCIFKTKRVSNGKSKADTIPSEDLIIVDIGHKRTDLILKSILR